MFRVVVVYTEGAPVTSANGCQRKHKASIPAAGSTTSAGSNPNSNSAAGPRSTTAGSMISALKASWRTWNRSKSCAILFCERRTWSQRESWQRSETHSISRTYLLSSSFLVRASVWMDLSRSFPAVSPNDSRNNGLDESAFFEVLWTQSCVSRRAPIFPFNFQNPLFSQTLVFWKIEKAYSCAFGTVIIATKRRAVHHAASQTPCEWVALCQVWRHFRTTPTGSRKIREKTPFCFFRSDKM